MHGETFKGEHGTYRLERELGSGGFGVTWLAQRVEDGATVVVKKLHASRLKDWKSMELFEREARVLEALQHPNIPAYLDYFPLGRPGAPEGFALVQTHVDGESFEEIRRSPRTLPPSQMLAWLERLLEVLEYLHSRTPPVIHRDISPKNVMLERQSGQPVLIDFGTVQAKITSETGLGSTSAGTFGYAPHEQFVGRASPASDLYSLGVTFLTVATGRTPDQLPFEDNRFLVRETLRGHDYSDVALDVLHDMTAPVASQRPQTAREVLERLRSPAPPDRGLVSIPPILVPPPVPETASEPFLEPTPTSKGASGGCMVFTVLLAIVLLGAVGGLVYWIVMMGGLLPDGFTETPHPQSFDVQAFVPEAQQKAHETWSDAELSGISVNALPRDGIANLEDEDTSTVIYYFRSKRQIEKYQAALAANPRVKPEISCKLQVLATSDYYYANVLDDYDECETLTDVQPPTCSFSEVWDKAELMGAPVEVGRGDISYHPTHIEALGTHVGEWRLYVGEDAYEISDRCGEQRLFAPNAPPIFERFDVDGYQSVAASLMAEKLPGLDLQLTSISAEGVYPDGHIDLTLNPEFEASYSFIARVPNPDAHLPVGASSGPSDPCASGHVKVDQTGVQVYGGHLSECPELSPVLPTCSFAAAWTHAIARGAPATDAVADMRLSLSGGQGNWSVSIGNVFSEYFPDDCVR